MPMLELTSNQSLETVQERKTVLLVDDEAVIRDLCKRVLNGYDIVEAADGQEAYEIFLRGGIDVILTDVMMPRLDGIELLKKLKEREPTMVVIIMTGFADKDLILKALKADADDFITKPLNLLQLKSAIEKALVKKALKEEIANLRNLDRFKTVFLSLISHKFRTPITSISLFLQNLAAGIIDPSDDGAKEHIKLIYNEACYLGNLVTDLLTFSSVMDSGGGLHLEPCTLNLLLPKILSEAHIIAARPGVTTHITQQTIPELMLDRDKISFALRQVIDNAIKFSREDGVVCVNMRNAEGQCEISIEDNGIGISKDQLPKLFEKFYQVDADRTGQVRGFGLGLFYAREFIRMHGGSISIESEENQGTRVLITLPNTASQSP